MIQKKYLTKYRLKVAAFFNNEYAMRHILHNPRYREHILQIPHLKNTISSHLKDEYLDSIADAFVDYHVFYHQMYQDMDIFRSALIARAMRHGHGDSDTNSEVERLLSTLMRDPEFEKFIHNIAEISLKHGVYATRVDTFLNKKYFPEMILEDQISNHTEPTFIKKDFYYNANWMPLWAGVTDTYETPLHERSSASEHIAFYVDYEELDENFEDVIDRITSVLAMLAYEHDPEKHTKDDTISYHYLNSLFKTTTIKDNHNEISNRLFGLIMWDNVMLGNTTQKEAFIKTTSTIRLWKQTGPCQETSCSESCINFEDCFSLARRIYRTTDKSIAESAIQTTKD